MFAWLTATFRPGTTLLELGSGAGSVRLGSYFRAVSVEHDSKWLEDGAKRGCPVVYAPIEDGWYAKQVVVALMRAIRPAVLLVDGPPSSIGRRGVMCLAEGLGSFGVEAVVFDDTEREHEAKLVDDFVSAVAGRFTTVRRFADEGKSFTAVQLWT